MMKRKAVIKKAMTGNELENRCEELLARGEYLSKTIPIHDGEPNYWYPDEYITELQAWIASVANILRLVATPDTYFITECKRILEDEHLAQGVPYRAVQKLNGLLKSVLEEIKHGLLRKAAYIFAATTFDDFLDHASEYHKAGKKSESSVLASAVFEDTVRKVAEKNVVQQSGIALETVIDNLVKADVLSAVKAKRIKGHAAVRNKALHAQWQDYDIKDVGEMIRGTREMIETLL